MNEFRNAVEQSGLTSTIRICQLVDEYSNAGSASLPIILDALKHPLSEVRGAAARALGRIEDNRPVVIEALTSMLSDEALIVQQSAVAALGVLGPLPVQTVSLLKKLLDAEDRHVREFAAMALDSEQEYRAQISWAC